MPVAQVVTVHVAHQHHINFSQAGVFSTRHCAASVVQNPGAIRIFENHGAVKATKLALLATQRGHFDQALGWGLRLSSEGKHTQQGNCTKEGRNCHTATCLNLG